MRKYWFQLLLCALLSAGIWLIHNLSQTYVSIVSVPVQARSSVPAHDPLSINEATVTAQVRASGYSLLSLARRALNRPRPYEVYDLPPLLHKETQGKSFPSRHVFSICVIGTSLLYILPPLGAALLVLGALLAVARVVSGVHFVRDVVSGAVIGVLSAVIGFSI